MKSPLLQMAKGLKAPFVDQRIRGLSEVNLERLLPFVVEETWMDQTDIEVSKIVGFEDPTYIGLTWIEFLKQGQRMTKNLKLLDQNPGYYLSEPVKLPKMSFVEVDGDLYVDADGKHRSCIAKFYFFHLGRERLNGVELRRYALDHQAAKEVQALSEKLESIGKVILSVTRKLVERKDDPGWKIDSFQSLITLKNRRTGVSQSFEAKEASWLLQELTQTSWIRRTFPRSTLDQLMWK